MAKRRSNLGDFDGRQFSLDMYRTFDRCGFNHLNSGLRGFNHHGRRRSRHQRQRLFFVVKMAIEFEIAVRTCPEPVEQVRYIVCTIHRLPEALTEIEHEARDGPSR
ncbi:hypothetical protein D3C84_648080 [compost metagenome]